MGQERWQSSRSLGPARNEDRPVGSITRLVVSGYGHAPPRVRTSQPAMGGGGGGLKETGSRGGAGRKGPSGWRRPRGPPKGTGGHHGTMPNAV